MDFKGIKGKGESFQIQGQCMSMGVVIGMLAQAAGNHSKFFFFLLSLLTKTRIQQWP